MKTAEQCDTRPTTKLTIEEWLTAQDRAVEREYKRLRKRKAAADTRSEMQEHAESTLASYIAALDIIEAWRARLEGDGYDIDSLVVVFRYSEIINRLAVNSFERGFLDKDCCPSASGHQIEVMHEIVDGKRVSRFLIDGKRPMAATDRAAIEEEGA